MTDEILDAQTWSGLEYLEAVSGPGAIAEMVGDFQRDAPARLVRMQAALEALDLQGLARLAHDLKSNSATLGARRLSALAERIEHGAQIEPPETLASWVRDTGAALPEVLTALAERVTLYP